VIKVAPEGTAVADGPTAEWGDGRQIETAPKEARIAPAISAIAEWRVSASSQSERTKAAVSRPSSGRPGR